MSISDHPRVLVGFAEALAAPEVAWSLLEAGYEVAAFSRRGSHAALRHCRSVGMHPLTAAERDADRALLELKELIDSIAPDAVMPLDDSAVWLCDLAARGTTTVIAGPTGAQTALALDKRLQIDAAATAGFDVPDTWSSDHPEAAAGRSFEFPVMTKSALAVVRSDGRLVAGTRQACADASELAATLASYGAGTPFMVQPYIGGVGEGLFGLARRGCVECWSAHRRIRMMNPQGSGSSACVSIPVDDKLRRAGEALISDAGWDGIFMIELLRDAAGKAWFVELNGRAWGSMALARRTGFEYPAWAVAARLDEGFAAPASPPHKPIVTRHLGRELVHLLIVLRGRPSSALVSWPSRQQALRGVLRIRRGERWYNLRRGSLRLFVYDTLRTVAGAVKGARP